MTPTITAFEASPDEGQGLARDMRVRWALEEVGQAYRARLVSMAALKEPTHRALQPFGSIPTYEEGKIVLFESGAIVLHLARTRPGLLPEGGGARARCVAWLFAALNTVEPPIVERETIAFEETDPERAARHRALVDARIRSRLEDLARALGDRPWLEGGFSAADLMMVEVLRRIDAPALLAPYPTLVAYVERGRDRPAFRRAFAAQLAVFERGRDGRAASDDL